MYNVLHFKIMSKIVDFQDVDASLFYDIILRITLNSIYLHIYSSLLTVRTPSILLIFHIFF